MLNVGQLIWVSVRPLIRLAITAGCGFAITKADIFPPVAARGAGQITLNVTLPCLMFSKIVPAFNSDNIRALGPLLLVSVLYQVIGVIIAWIVKQFFWVPHRFRYGLLVAGGWGNYGDIPTSVIMSITVTAPFNGTQDQNLSVAYLSVFIFVFMLTLFPLGGNRWIAKDFTGPDVENDEIREAMRLKRQKILTSCIRPLSILTHRHGSREADVEADENANQSKFDTEKDMEQMDAAPVHQSPRLPSVDAIAELEQSEHVREHDHARVSSAGKHVTFFGDDATTVVGGIPSQVHTPAQTDFMPSTVVSPAPSVTHVDPQASPRAFADHSHPLPLTSTSTRPKRWITRNHITTFIRTLLAPPTLSILISFPVALIQVLKDLFILAPSSPIPNAPDGQPPLAFIMDAAQFIGAASVPLGLICLGSALARLHVPSFGDAEGWRRMPLGAIGALAVGRMLVMPVLGVLICQGLTSAGVIDKSDKVLRFVCIFFSCLPTATTQVVLTQVYSGTGTAEHLSPFLIPQYILMFVSMVALTAYSLELLF